MAEQYRPWLWKAPEGGAIGKRRIRRIDGYEKASGKAIYVRDIYRPGMLYGKLYLSPHTHAKIKRMDTSKAEALPGVRAILRYDDPEEIKVKSAPYSRLDLLIREFAGRRSSAVSISLSSPSRLRALTATPSKRWQRTRRTGLRAPTRWLPISVVCCYSSSLPGNRAGN